MLAYPACIGFLKCYPPVWLICLEDPEVSSLVHLTYADVALQRARLCVAAHSALNMHGIALIVGSFRINARGIDARDVESL